MKKILALVLLLGMVSFTSVDSIALTNPNPFDQNNGTRMQVTCEVDGAVAWRMGASSEIVGDLVQACRVDFDGKATVESRNKITTQQEVLSRKFLLDLEKERRKAERENDGSEK